MKAFSKHALSLLALVCLTSSSLISTWAAPGTVFFVVGSDTAIWNYPVKAPTTVDAYTRHPYYKQDFFTAPTGVAYQVMDQGFRDRFKDSFGQSLKITWWMMGGNIYRDATNLNVPLDNTMTLYLMKKYHGHRIQQLGDEISLHYHTFIWSDYNGGTTPTEPIADLWRLPRRLRCHPGAVPGGGRFPRLLSQWLAFHGQ